MNARFIGFLILFLCSLFVTAFSGLSAQQFSTFPICGVEGAAWRHALGQPPLLNRNEEVYRIPVAVHIVWKEEAENLTDRQVRAQIDALNADFRMQNASARFLPEPFAALASDARIEFCLLSANPDGSPATGITRTNTLISNIGDARAPDGRRILCDDALGGKTPYDTRSILNIYVCDLSFLGIVPAAIEPALLHTPEDVIILNYRAFSTINTTPPYHLGTTLTHEVGHFLGLAHPWGINPSNCAEDDGIADTPPQGRTYLGFCPATPTFSCGSSDMYMNFMNFTDDACLSAFTSGQVEAMRHFLRTIRPALLTTPILCSSPPTPPRTLSRDQVHLFPNPARDRLNLEINIEPSILIHWHITNLTGSFITSGTRTAGEYRPLFINPLARGWYTLHLTTGQDTPLIIPFLKL